MLKKNFKNLKLVLINRNKTEHEENFRYKIFKENLKLIDEKNSTNSLIEFGITQFADLKDSELTKYIMPINYKYMIEQYIEDELMPPKKFNFTILNNKKNLQQAKNFDWRKNGVVVPVKNQAQCGSCWAFAVTGVCESLNAIKTNQLISLSEQQLIDCDYQNNGCHGGYRPNAFRYIIEHGLVNGKKLSIYR